MPLYPTSPAGAASQLNPSRHHTSPIPKPPPHPIPPPLIPAPPCPILHPPTRTLFSSRWRSKVVFPAPRKPESTLGKAREEQVGTQRAQSISSQKSAHRSKVDWVHREWDRVSLLLAVVGWNFPIGAVCLTWKGLTI